MSKLDLPSGAVAELRDLSARPVKQKERKALMAVREQDDTGMRLMDHIVAAVVESWSLPFPPPSEDIASIDELDVRDYDALMEATGPFQALLFGAKAAGDPADPKAGSGS